MRATGLNPLTVQQALSVAPALTVYGEVAVGGAIVFVDQSIFSNWEAHGGQGTSKAVYTLHQLTAICRRPGGIEGFTGFFFNEKYYPINRLKQSTFPLAGATVYDLTGGSTSGFNPNALDYAAQIQADRKGSNEHPAFYPVSIEMGRADNTTSGMYAARPIELADKSSNFTNDAEGRDVAWVHTMMRLIDGYISGEKEVGGSEKLWSSGVPRISHVAQGNKVYDPRIRNQHIDDPGSWQYSSNQALAISDYMMNYWPIKLQENDLDAVKWMADHADENRTRPAPLNRAIPYTAPPGTQTPSPNQEISSPGGTVVEPRYQVDVALPLANTTNEQNVGILLSAGANILTYSSGKWVQVPRQYRAPILAIDSDWLLAPIGYSSNNDLQDMYSGVQGSYRSRSHLYEEVLTSPQVEPDLEKRLGGPVNRTEVYAGVTRGSQVQELTALETKKQLPQEKIALNLIWAASRLRVGSTFTFQDDILFPEPKEFMVESISLEGRFPVSLTAIENDEDYYEDLQLSQYHREPTLGVINLGATRPERPFDFAARVDAESNRHHITWDLGSESVDAVKLWSSPTANFADAVLVEGLGKAATEYFEETTGTRFYWVQVVKNGLTSLRNPNDDISTISSTIGARSLPIEQDLAPGRFPDERIGVHQQKFIARDLRAFLKSDPPPSLFDLTIVVGLRNAVAMRWMTSGTDGSGGVTPGFLLRTGRADEIHRLDVTTGGTVTMTPGSTSYTNAELLNIFTERSGVVKNRFISTFTILNASGSAPIATRPVLALFSYRETEVMPTEWFDETGVTYLRAVELYTDNAANSSLRNKARIAFTPTRGDRNPFNSPSGPRTLNAVGRSNFRLFLRNPQNQIIVLSLASSTGSSPYTVDLTASQRAWVQEVSTNNRIVVVRGLQLSLIHI